MIPVINGSILEANADAIVNAANGHLNHGGGLARAIDQAAQTLDGRVIDVPIAENTPNPNLRRIWRWVHDHQRAPLIATGNAHATSAGMLPFQAVIHAVGPIWNGGSYDEGTLLYLAYLSACRVAHEVGVERVAFPAISAGIFGYPIAGVAQEAIAALTMGASLYGVKSSIYVTDDDHERAFIKAQGSYNA